MCSRFHELRLDRMFRRPTRCRVGVPFRNNRDRLHRPQFSPLWGVRLQLAASHDSHTESDTVLAGDLYPWATQRNNSVCHLRVWRCVTRGGVKCTTVMSRQQPTATGALCMGGGVLRAIAVFSKRLVAATSDSVQGRVD